MPPPSTELWSPRQRGLRTLQGLFTVVVPLLTATLLSDLHPFVGSTDTWTIPGLVMGAAMVLLTGVRVRRENRLLLRILRSVVAVLATGSWLLIEAALAQHLGTTRLESWMGLAVPVLPVVLAGVGCSHKPARAPRTMLARPANTAFRWPWGCSA